MKKLIWIAMCLMWGVFMYAQPAVYFAPISATINESGGSITIAANLTAIDANPITIDVAVDAASTAQNGTDFTYSPTSLLFPANSFQQQIFTVNIIDNLIVNGNKIVVFKLRNVSANATIGVDSIYTLTIRDDDSLVINTTPFVDYRNEDVQIAYMPVTLNRASQSNTSVDIKNVVGGSNTAVKGVDFYFNDTTITWLAGDSGLIRVPVYVVNNIYYEPARQAQFLVTNANNAAKIVDSIYTLVINENGFRAACKDLFFSEYVEGSGNNQALQLYNPTDYPVNLSAYQIIKSVNAGTVLTNYQLSGTIAAKSTYLMANPAATNAITSVANVTNAFFSFDGTEALALVHGADTTDIIGQLYVSPGAGGWQVIGGSTTDHTLIRWPYNYAGSFQWTVEQIAWRGYPIDMLDSLTSHHTAPCGTPDTSTLQFITVADTVFDTATIVPVVIRLYNTNYNNVSYVVGRNDLTSTAVQGLDWYFSNRAFSHFLGLYYDTVYVTVLANTNVQATVKAELSFYGITGDVTVLPDSANFDLYITNNNKLFVSFLGAGFAYPKDTSLVEIKVTLSGYVSYPVSANVTLAPGDAINGVDFTFNDTTITFPAYSIDTQGVWVRILNNNLAAGNRQANFNLTNQTAGTLDVSAYTLTIINVDTTASGINDISFNALLNIFPNPVSDVLSIETDVDLKHVQITDLTGKVIMAAPKITAGKNLLNVSTLPAGMYFISAQGVSRKFVKL